MPGLSLGAVVVVVVAAVAAGFEVFVGVFVAVSCCITAVGTVRNIFILVVVHVLVANDIVLLFVIAVFMCWCRSCHRHNARCFVVFVAMIVVVVVAVMVLK